MNIEKYIDSAQEYCYKNDYAFLCKSNDICYISEYDLKQLSDLSDNGIDKSDKELINENYAHNYQTIRNEIKSFLDDNEDCPYGIDELTVFIYEKAEWADISTYLMELDW